MSGWQRQSGGIFYGPIWFATFALLIILIVLVASMATASAQTAGPVVTSVSVPAHGYYKAGDTLSFTVNFDQNAVVNTGGGTPSLPLTVGSTSRHADYVAAVTTSAVFQYTVQPGDIDLDGIQLGGSISLNGGTIQNGGGDPAALTLNNVGNTDGVLVYTVAPTVLSTKVIGNPPSNAASVTFEIVFSEPVTGLTLSDLVLTATGTAVARLSNLQTSNNITYMITADSVSGSGTLRLDVPPNAVVNIGNNGNPAYMSGTPWVVGLSSNADLSQLQTDVSTFSPTFDPAVLNYSISVANGATEISLTPTASEPNATIRVNGTAVTSGTASAPVLLAVGSTAINVVVTAQDGTMKTYQVNVTRAAASVADLSGLRPSVGVLSPAFSPTTFAYGLNVGNNVENITFTPTASDPTATIAVNGTTVASGGTSAPLSLLEGMNQISVIVTAQDGTTARTYTVSVTRSKPLPTAASRTIQLVAGTTATVDLAEGASGGPFTTAAITSVSAPDAGTVRLEAQQKRLTFYASPTFSGSAEVGYTLSNAFGTSAPATITFAVIARPDPTKDPEVIGLLRAQAESAKRFAQNQTRNFNNRLEQLHDERDRRRNSMAVRLGYRQSDNKTSAHQQLDRMVGHGTDSTAPGLLGYAPDSDTSSTSGPKSAFPTSDLQEPDFGRYAIWSGGFIDFAERDNGGLDIGSTTIGLSAGIDYRFSERFVGGFGFGYGHDKSDVSDNGTESRAHAYSAAIYGSYKPMDHLFLDGLIGGSWLDFDSRRYVTANGDFASGNRDGSQIFGSFTAAYEFRDQKWLVSPYGRFELSRSWLDGFAESGGGIYGLTFGDQTVDTIAGIFGIRGSYSFNMDWGTLTPGARAEFTHDFAGSSRISLGYTDIGTLPYALETDEVGADYATLGLSLDAALYNDWSLGFDYRTALGSGRQDHAVGFKIGTRF
ncbi:MAG: autotransporter domain-containing protein [Phyllobacterium sp.]